MKFLKVTFPSGAANWIAQGHIVSWRADGISGSVIKTVAPPDENDQEISSPLNFCRESPGAIERAIVYAADCTEAIITVANFERVPS